MFTFQCQLMKKNIIVYIVFNPARRREGIVLYVVVLYCKKCSYFFVKKNTRAKIRLVHCFMKPSLRTYPTRSFCASVQVRKITAAEEGFWTEHKGPF